MTGVELLQSVQYVTVKGKQLAVVCENDLKAILEHKVFLHY